MIFELVRKIAELSWEKLKLFPFLKSPVWVLKWCAGFVRRLLAALHGRFSDWF
jgi:hypothetical protein